MTTQTHPQTLPYRVSPLRWQVAGSEGDVHTVTRWATGKTACTCQGARYYDHCRHQDAARAGRLGKATVRVTIAPRPGTAAAWQWRDEVA